MLKILASGKRMALLLTTKIMRVLPLNTVKTGSKYTIGNGVIRHAKNWQHLIIVNWPGKTTFIAPPLTI